MSFFRPSGVARFTAPIEPSAERRTAARIADIDDQLAAIAAVPPQARTPELWWRLDRLLDLRNAIAGQCATVRPSVPVIPGRPT